MGLDIKIPIGAMFLVFGVLLTIFGIATNGDAMYEISINTNINLFSGIFMILFGGFMLLISDLVRKKKIVDEEFLKDEVKEELKK